MYKGEGTCQGFYKNGKKCELKPYYEQSGSVYCGRHSDKEVRKVLKVNPNAEVDKNIKIKEHMITVEESASENKQDGYYGDVICTKLKMMGSPEFVEGYLNVYPNFKHGNRKDGYGCPSLSPKSLGPIEHIMPNLPPAQNLENFHQFSKVFPFEIDENDNIKEESVRLRYEAYLDPIPHRHKYDAKELKKYGNVNIPSFSVYYDAEGYEYRFTYFECRYFYCKLYERMVLDNKDFIHLSNLLRNGYNLNIVGYDGYPVTKTLQEHYHDTSRPFGHELCLYTLLTMENKDEYPWNVEYKSNKLKYRRVGIF